MPYKWTAKQLQGEAGDLRKSQNVLKLNVV